MHEISIVQSTLDLAMQTAKASSATQIHCLRLRVGVLSGVVGEALQFAFEILREGTMAAQARLEIESVPAACWCPTCEAAFEPKDWVQQCPRCERISAELRQGRELELVSLEVT